MADISNSKLGIASLGAALALLMSCAPPFGGPPGPFDQSGGPGLFGQRGGAGPGGRAHSATKGARLELGQATQNPGENRVEIHEEGTRRIIRSNAIPNHLVGAFPNRGNPNRIAAQNQQFSVPIAPKLAARTTSAQGWVFGVALNGVVFDPFTAESWRGDMRSGWNYEALGGAIPLGLDENYAHVQPGGTYHYHGHPRGLLEKRGARQGRAAHSPLIGYAADGFPIYAFTGAPGGKITTMRSSYRLKAGNRPGGRDPGGAHDGAFVQDWEYVAGLGNLDRCNGAHTISSEYPKGSYAYFISEDWPMIPRCFRGTPDQSFRKGPPR